MPNEFQSISPGAGLLKNYYDTGSAQHNESTPIGDALRKKRKKSFEKISDALKGPKTLDEEGDKENGD